MSFQHNYSLLILGASISAIFPTMMHNFIEKPGTKAVFSFILTCVTMSVYVTDALLSRFSITKKGEHNARKQSNKSIIFHTDNR